MVTSAPGIIIGPGIWFQEEDGEMFLKGFFSSLNENLTSVEPLEQLISSLGLGMI